MIIRIILFKYIDYLYSNISISGCFFASLNIGPFAINPIAKWLPLPESNYSFLLIPKACKVLSGRVILFSSWIFSQEYF